MPDETPAPPPAPPPAPFSPVLVLDHNVEYQLIDEATGEVVEEWSARNLICTQGKNLLLLAASPKYVNDFQWICIGTGTTAAAAGDTALVAETARLQGATTNPTPTQWQCQVTFPAGTGTGAITESALDYASSATAAILARQVFTARNKTSGLALKVKWTVS